MAEVLITLGIIGVVAAMTLPTLIQNHNKKVVETRLMKFYSTMNQAIQLAEVDYGERETWYAKYDDLDTDIKGRPVTGKSYREKWFNKYLAPYMKIVATNYDIAGDENPVFIFADGSGVRYRGDTSSLRHALPSTVRAYPHRSLLPASPGCPVRPVLPFYILLSMRIKVQIFYIPAEPLNHISMVGMEL